MSKSRSYQTGEALESLAADAREHITEVVDAVRHDVSELAGTARAKADEAREYVADRASAARDRAQAFKDDDLARLRESGVDYVRNNPGRALMVAAGVGLVLGYLYGTKRL